MITWLFERFPSLLEGLWWKCWRGYKYNWGPNATKRGIIHFIQRGARGWADEDTWSLDDYLTRVIIGSVRHIMESVHGCPMSLCEDGDVDAGVKKWNVILYDIVIGFEASKLLKALDYSWWEYRDRKQTDRSKAREAELIRVRDKGMALFVEYYDALWT